MRSRLLTANCRPIDGRKVYNKRRLDCMLAMLLFNVVNNTQSNSNILNIVVKGTPLELFRAAIVGSGGRISDMNFSR